MLGLLAILASGLLVGRFARRMTPATELVLLGLIAGALFVRTRRLWPVVTLHAVANATPILFLSVDARWLDWLGILYQ